VNQVIAAQHPGQSTGETRGHERSSHINNRLTTEDEVLSLQNAEEVRLNSALY
jgi:hypothetical protein